MSLKPFIFNEYTVYIIQYSYTDYDGKKHTYKRPTQAKDELEALQDARDNLLVTHHPDFFMTIVGKKTYRKK